MDQQEVALEFCGVGQGRIDVVVRRVLGRSAHVALGIDVVVKTPVGHRGDGDGGFKYFGTLHQAVRRHESTVGPAPDSDAAGVDVGVLGQGLRGGDLVFDLVLAELQVGNFFEVAALGAGSAVVHAHDPVALCRQVLAPEVAAVTPALGDLLASRTAVHKHEYGVFFAGVKV